MRRTRIVATIGPASQDDAMLSALLSAGVNVCRLNYSHGEPEQKTELYARIRSMEQELGRPTCILADLPGPKLRLGEFDGVHVLTMGNEVTLHCGVANMADASAHKLPVQYDGLSQELQPGDPVLLSDGLIRLSVISATGQRSGTVVCRVEDGGPISSRKGINVPGTLVDLPAIGPKDELALEHALDTGADLIAVSYVRTPEDMQPAKDAIKARGLSTWLVAKIEHPMALKQLDAILDVADAVMVARGDLGVEIPLEAVQTMAKIALSTEQGLDSSQLKPESITRFKSTRAVAHAGVELAKMAKASRILVATERGNAPRLVSSYRPTIPVTAVTNSIATARKVQLLPGVDSMVTEELDRGSLTMQAALTGLVNVGTVLPKQKIVAISGSPKAISGMTSTARLYRVSEAGEIIGTE